MSRREKTERQILLALEEQIRETGMGGVGINAIAKRAGVSKELIYRYFDGMPGLMLAWMREQDFWTRNPGAAVRRGQPAHAGRPGAVHVARAGRGPRPATTLARSAALGADRTQ